MLPRSCCWPCVLCACPLASKGNKSVCHNKAKGSWILSASRHMISSTENITQKVRGSERDKGWQGPLDPSDHPLLQQGHRGQNAKDHICMGIRELQREHRACGQPMPAHHHPHSTEALPGAQRESTILRATLRNAQLSSMHPSSGGKSSIPDRTHLDKQSPSLSAVRTVGDLSLRHTPAPHSPSVPPQGAHPWPGRARHSGADARPPHSRARGLSRAAAPRRPAGPAPQARAPLRVAAAPGSRSRRRRPLRAA